MLKHFIHDTWDAAFHAAHEFCSFDCAPFDANASAVVVRYTKWPTGWRVVVNVTSRGRSNDFDIDTDGEPHRTRVK